MERLLSLFLPVALLLAICLAGSAEALTVAPPTLPPLAQLAGEASEEAEELESECDEEVAAEEGEECEGELLEVGSPVPPEACLLRTARARVFAYTSQGKARLVIRYTSVSPAEVLVDYRARGGKGTVTPGEARQHFSRKGISRLTEHLSPGEMEKLRAAHTIEVDLRIPSAPSSCDRFYTRHLTIRRSIHNQVVWFQSDSIFGG